MTRPAPMARSKRLFDLVVGLLLSVVTFPILVVLCVISALRFRAFPLFVHERIGLDGKSIRCVKIRSLGPHVPPYLDKAELQDHGGEERWAAWMRRTHLDELPQFWQVVTGTFSLVGPRPMIESIVDRMPKAVAEIRHSVRPGVTGPWQISVDGSELIEDTCDYDLAYIRHANWWVDIRVILWTAAQAVGVPKRTKQKVFDLMDVKSDEPHVRPLRPVGIRETHSPGTRARESSLSLNSSARPAS